MKNARISPTKTQIGESEMQFPVFSRIFSSELLGNFEFPAHFPFTWRKFGKSATCLLNRMIQYKSCYI